MTDFAKYPTEDWAETDPIEGLGERRAWWRKLEHAPWGGPDRIALVVTPDGVEQLHYRQGTVHLMLPADLVRKVLG